VSVEEQERKLITLVEEYRDRECSQLLDQANNTRQEMIRTAYRDARQHLHQAVERERARAISHIRSTEAELHTRRRAVEQREAESFLKQGWQILEQALMKQWSESEDRLGWLERCAEEALKRLPKGHWTVQHPEDCTPQELTHFSDLVTRGPADTTMDMQVVPAIKAGLVIGSSNARLDMSLEGLLKDTKSVEARMLALLNPGAEQ